MVHVEVAAAAEVVTAAAVMAVVTAVAVMAAVTAVVVMAVVTAVALVILNLLLTRINLLEQKVGKIEVMEICLKILTLKTAEVEEKEALQVILKYLKKGIKNPFFVTLKHVGLRNQYLILV